MIYNTKDYKDMTHEEKKMFREYKGWIVTNYMGVKTPLSSIKARLQSFLDETKNDRSSIWD
jgi:hypothetical protein